jgi:glutathione peroxidase-family protein
MEFTSAEVNFDSAKYKLIVNSMFVEPSYRFAFVDLYDEKRNIKEQTYDLKEFIKLNGNYYKIDSITLDGRTITLIMEKGLPLIREGTQISWNPIPFEMKTVSGDTVCFPYGFRGQYVLLCFWRAGSYDNLMLKEMKDLYYTYKKKGLIIIGIAMGATSYSTRILNGYSLPWPVISVSLDHPLLKAYKINCHNYQKLLIGPNGKIIAKYYTDFDNKEKNSLQNIFK